MNPQRLHKLFFKNIGNIIYRFPFENTLLPIDFNQLRNRILRNIYFHDFQNGLLPIYLYKYNILKAIIDDDV